MKKFIFPIFAICIYSPSFGACNHIYGPVPSGNKYLESRFHFTNYPAYLQCGGFTTNDAQCTQGDIVVGKDRYLYRCTDAGWVKVNDDDTDLPDCRGSRQQNVGLDPIMPSNSRTYMYLVQYFSNSETTSYRCKMKQSEDTNAQSTCIITCGDYYSGICDRDHAKDITIKIVDSTSNAITSASIKYPDLTAPNNTINIATQKGNGDYALCLNANKTNLNIQISAQGYSPTTKTVADLLNSKTITLQRNNNSTPQKQGSVLPAAANEQSSIMDTSSKLIITCENKGDINCKLPDDYILKPLTDCKELKKDLITDKNILRLNANTFNNCNNIGPSIANSKCPAIQRVFIGQSDYVLYCITNPNIEVRYTNEQTDKWSYAQKKCVGSWGKWKNGECDCSALDGTENINNECICTKNKNQKYYNKLWSGCETLQDEVYQAGTHTKIFGFWENLSKIDRLNSCPPSGGTWGGKGNNVCKCNPRLNLEPDDSAYFCNCKAGYDYKNPLAKTDGCEPINNIQGYHDSPSVTTETANEEQPTITNTDPKKNCIGTDGNGLDENGKCICDPDEHLVEYKYEDKYSICRCMDGYHRVGEPDGNGKYAATGKCVYAPETQTKIERDDMAMQRDAEDAYRNEYDNAQSWANKGTTALSTLATGEGAMMAARAIAEKIADDNAEREMAEYVSTMKCEYGGGQSVNLGDTETLPGGNELTNYYAEYKQLADKLKATKAALNLRPGIEAEVLYDRAETGLYQYQTAERQSGGFTSLSRALMNPDGTDATAWNAQRAETNQNLLVGGALATVGLAGSYIANRAINKDHVKEYKELEEKFNKIEQKLLNKYPEAFVPEEIPVKPSIEEPIIDTIDEIDPIIEQTQPAPQLDFKPFSDKYLFASGSYIN